jgi:Protein of unknown function (DUF1579)
MEFRIRRVVLIFLSIGFLAVSIPSHAATPELKPQLTPLEYFIGNWACSGKFDANGKSIDAHQRFDIDLDGAWIMFRHDDTPPFNYHALSEWGWDATQKKFVMTVQDSIGGARVFYSGGWNSTQLQWDGEAVGNASNPTQRFTFERVDERHFKVSYFFLKSGAWSRMDSSTCTKQ